MAVLEDKVNVGQISLIAIVGIAVTYAIVVVLQIMYFKMKDDMEARRGTGSSMEAGIEVRAEQQTRLNSYGYVDKENGVVRLPIGVAMERTITELAN